MVEDKNWNRDEGKKFWKSINKFNKDKSDIRDETQNKKEEDFDDKLHLENFDTTMTPKNNEDDSIVSFEKPEIASIDLDSATKLSQIIQETQNSFSIGHLLNKTGRQSIKGTPMNQRSNAKKKDEETEISDATANGMIEGMGKNREEILSKSKEENPDTNIIGDLANAKNIEPDPAIVGSNIATEIEKDLKETPTDAFVKKMEENFERMDQIINYLEQNPNENITYKDLIQRVKESGQTQKKENKFKKCIKYIGKGIWNHKKISAAVLIGGTIFAGLVSLLSGTNEENLEKIVNKTEKPAIVKTIEEEKSKTYTATKDKEESKTYTTKPTEEPKPKIKVVDPNKYERKDYLELNSSESDNPGKFEIYKKNNKWGMNIAYSNKYGRQFEHEVSFDSEYSFQKTKEFLEKEKRKLGQNWKQIIFRRWYNSLLYLDFNKKYDGKIDSNSFQKKN